MIKYKTSNLFKYKVLFKRKEKDMRDYNKIVESKDDVDMNRRKLKYPCIYKHFKGKYYATMGLSKATNNDDIENICKLYSKEDLNKNENKYKIVIRHTEREDDICVYIDLDGKFYHKEEKDKNDLVLYKTLYDDTGIFARPLDMFLSKVDIDKYFNPIQKYRFEEFYK
ncbi:DUF1653 domain-containing protein [Clostridioides sp. GD02404]|uniref:DUF1653 domain-containing protein n=1 Tax=Clostridioides sp. GD02404 TaxID=3054354 RepID=UPI0038B1502B